MGDKAVKTNSNQ